MPKALTWVLTTYGEPRLSQRIAGLALVVPIMITTAIRELKKKKKRFITHRSWRVQACLATQWGSWGEVGIRGNNRENLGFCLYWGERRCLGFWGFTLYWRTKNTRAGIWIQEGKSRGAYLGYPEFSKRELRGRHGSWSWGSASSCVTQLAGCSLRWMPLKWMSLQSNVRDLHYNQKSLVPSTYTTNRTCTFH